MQNHPIINYLRILGLSAGIIMFVFMLFRAEQNAHDPVFVKGKPSLQWLATSSTGLSSGSPISVTSGAVAAASTVPNTTTQPTTTVPESPQSTHEPASTKPTPVPAQQTPPVTQASVATINHGQAISKQKRTN